MDKRKVIRKIGKTIMTFSIMISVGGLMCVKLMSINDMNYISYPKSEEEVRIDSLESKVESVENKYEEEIQKLNTEAEIEIERLKMQYEKELVKTKKDISTITALNKYLGGKLEGMGESFFLAGKTYKVNSKMLVAIAIHETANGTSNVLQKANNVGGINKKKGYESYGRYTVYSTVEESIFDMAKLIRKYYIDEGLTSIDLIGQKYCPSNDPDDAKFGYVNQHWIPKVTELYNKIAKTEKELRNG